MNKTPETDAEQHEGLLRGNPMPTQVVHVNFARKLEHSRDEWAAMCGRYKQERDEAKDEAQRLRVENNHNWQAIEFAEEAVKERDEVREALKKCREDSICYAEHMRKCGYSEAYKESKENADRATRILEETK